MEALNRAVLVNDPVVALDNDQLAAIDQRGFCTGGRKAEVFREGMENASFSTVFGSLAISGLRMCVEGVPSTGRPHLPSGIRVSSSFS